MNPEAPDEEILRQSFRDPSQFKFLVARYQDPFIRKAMGIVRRQEDAEDIVQETFVKIYKYGKNFQKRAGIEFKSWAYKILMNTAFTRYQDVKKRSDSTEYLDPVLYDEEKPLSYDDNLGAVSDAKAAVKAVIEKMPEHLGRILGFYYLEDKSYKDICKLEKISMTTLKMRLFRAKRLFKNLSADSIQ
ncbi:MAG: RNA polymerase sigma factor [Candidatus Harrisonbacteria bacterium]|nr:RNA polymerase sigma factor [Candidatus Harrisonbacteria bacterium]